MGCPQERVLNHWSLQREKVVLEGRRTRKENGENPDCGKGAGSQGDEQRWKLEDAQGLSLVIVQKGHCEQTEPTEPPAQVSQNSSDFSTRVETKC